MGIPKFFKWLTRRYPLILQNIKIEEDCPPIDYLYLDLNGIVHNCIHGNDAKLHEKNSKLQDLEEVWANIMKSIDELVHVIKPQKLLFLAVDGVAPRAKMNQQRARRFRAAKDAQMLRQQLSMQGKEAPELFDSNSISPGTTFMNELNKQLAFFVQYKINTDATYQKIPGEGEHKMLDFIRQYKLDPQYDPNTRHCFYGADADLIMLSLLTHEPHFIIIREEHIARKIKSGGVQRIDLQRTSNFQIIYISLLREYFKLEYQDVAPLMKVEMNFNIERIIDDFAFFCFFIGNDFLPSIPTLDIGEGALDQLIDFYKKCLPLMDDYITDEGYIYWDRAQPFIQLLGEHESEIFTERLLKLCDSKNERVISFGTDFNEQTSIVDKKQLIQNKVKSQLFQKKMLKAQKLNTKNEGKRFKKYLLTKKFAEDSKQMETPLFKQQKQNLLSKFKAQKQSEYQSEPESQKEEEKFEQSLVEIIKYLKDEYLSDLQPHDIGDSDVSEVNEDDLKLEEIPQMGVQNAELDTKIQVQNELTERYENQNLQFVKNFVEQYATDPQKAISTYYSLKMKIDQTSAEGVQQKRKMIKKYLEGLQWVLFYYYKGCQQWRWYFPYHYAPMISDLGNDIIQNFLSGSQIIDVFEVDYNCSPNNEPYTPFQQLLSILPLKSLKLLPGQYSEIALGELKQSFPEDFDIDLNGRTVAWEAICLIPFVNEQVFLDAEARLLQRSQKFTDFEEQRNTISFIFIQYHYNPKKANADEPLNSTLTHLKDLPYNYAQRISIQDYMRVGEYTFKPEIHEKAIMPCFDFPSFTWLNVKEMEYGTAFFNKVLFKVVLVKIPKCVEDDSPEELEKLIHGFMKQSVQEIYIDFPFQHEGYPRYFESVRINYEIFQDVYDMNAFRVKKLEAHNNPEAFNAGCDRVISKYRQLGYSLGHYNVLVYVQRVRGVGQASKQHNFYKKYEENYDNFELVPLNMVMRKRHPLHYMSANIRVNMPASNFKIGKQVICLNQQLLGVVGTIQKIDRKNHELTVGFNIEKEESKMHDPFIGHNCLQQHQQYMTVEQRITKKYFTDFVIEKKLHLRKGVINKITSSFLISFNDPDTHEKQVYDIGLNIKNFIKKSHIPEYVRFVTPTEVADYQHDGFTHNTHARGANHQRPYFEFSEDCFQIIQNYYLQYPEVFEAVTKQLSLDYKKQKPVSSLRDVFPHLDQTEAINTVKAITKWIESLPISNLPFVEMGFNALSQELIQKIDKHQNVVRDTYTAIKLKCAESEALGMGQVFAEQYPYWSSPFKPKTTKDFKVGDRVMNINSTKREYVPFGQRGTVVGTTTDKVIVIFDEQFLQGDNVNGYADLYKGGKIDPNYLLNLTQKFATLSQTRQDIVQTFIPVSKVAEQQEQDQSQRRVFYKKKEEEKAKKIEEKMMIEGMQMTMEEMFSQLTQVYPEEEDYAQSYLAQIDYSQQPALYQEEQKQQIEETAKVEPTSGFYMDPQMMANPDFQQLLDLMKFAGQMQAPIPQEEGSASKQPAGLSLEAKEFVPAWRKKSTE